MPCPHDAVLPFPAILPPLLSWLAGCIGAGTNTPVGPATSSGFSSLVGINLQGDIDGWIEALPALQAVLPTLRFYEVPVIYEAGPLFRWWLNNGMRIGVVEREARRRTITVYTDREQFGAAIRLPDIEQIYTGLLDDKGRIIWLTAGPINNAARQDMLRVARQRVAHQPLASET